MNNEIAAEWQGLRNDQRNALIAKEVFGYQVYEKNGGFLRKDGNRSWPVKDFLAKINLIDIMDQVANNGLFYELAYDNCPDNGEPRFISTVFRSNDDGEMEILGAYTSKSANASLAVSAIMAMRKI